MNIRIAFRIQEQRDVDLILGQGMLKAGWHAHKLNAPGKFLIWSPEHDTPRRARAYLITDDDVRQAVTRHAPARPQLDAISRHALTAAPAPAVIPEPDGMGDSTRADPDPPAGERDAAGDALWLALCMAPEEGCGIAELIRLTGMTRSTLYRRLREHARQGHAIQVSRGRWRARTTDEPSP
jgi:hypothetical protein